MGDSSQIRGSVLWPGLIILGGLLILAFFLVFNQPVELALGASLSFVVLAFVSLMAGAGRAESEGPAEAPEDQFEADAQDDQAELPEPVDRAQPDAESALTIPEPESGSDHDDVR